MFCMQCVCVRERALWRTKNLFVTLPHVYVQTAPNIEASPRGQYFHYFLYHTHIVTLQFCLLFRVDRERRRKKVIFGALSDFMCSGQDGSRPVKVQFPTCSDPNLNCLVGDVASSGPFSLQFPTSSSSSQSTLGEADVCPTLSL